jgi:hypothetical protein
MLLHKTRDDVVILSMLGNSYLGARIYQRMTVLESFSIVMVAAVTPELGFQSQPPARVMVFNGTEYSQMKSIALSCN